MRGKYKAAIALLLIFILLPLTLLLTLSHWLPGLAGLWLPAGTRIDLRGSPTFARGALRIPDLRYLAADCELARVRDAELSRPSRWRLNVGDLTIDAACLSKLPAAQSSPDAPRSLAQWQAMLPYSWLTVDNLRVTPWPQWQGKLTVSLTPSAQEIRYQGPAIALRARLRGQTLTVSELSALWRDDAPPLRLSGEFTLPRLPGGLPVAGHAVSVFQLPSAPQPLSAELAWRGHQGQLVVSDAAHADPLLALPWQISGERIAISDGRWRWPYQGRSLSGGLSLELGQWRQGLAQMTIAGRLNALTRGDAGKGNAVLTFGPGRLGMEASDMPLRLTGEAKQGALIFYASLPARLSGPLSDPTLAFQPGALLLSRGRIIDAMNIDEVRWPLAGVKVTSRGIDGRLQAIARAHENRLGDFVLHLDGRADDFWPDSGRWRWHYWGDGRFTPMQARWDVRGTGEWRDRTIALDALSTGFDKLQYGAMRVSEPRLTLAKPIRWQRDERQPQLTGALALEAGTTAFSGGGALPPATLQFSLDGRDPASFQFRGDLHAGRIGPVRLTGRWDGERLRGQAWWPKQSLTVFQPLLPPAWKMRLRDGVLYAQVAFSAAPIQGFRAGGHGVVRGGGAWMPDNQINGVDFVLPFRFSQGGWRLGARRPVTLRIAEVVNQVTARNLTADLQGSWPWSEREPLLLSDVSVDILGGRLEMRQLRLPQREPALLRLQHISSSELISALNPKQFALSGAVNGALPLWLDNRPWIIKDGWLNNPGSMTLRVDKDTADALERDNIAAGAAINSLRYMEIARSWTAINLSNSGELTLRAAISGISRIAGKNSEVRLNYSHQENVFDLWRSLRFGDNLQAWLEQNAALPPSRCEPDGKCKEPR